MPTFRAFSRQLQQFTGNTNANLLLASKIPCDGARVGTMMLRVHAGATIGNGTGAPGATQLIFSVFREAPTTEDAADFVEGTWMASPPTGALAQFILDSTKLSTSGVQILFPVVLCANGSTTELGGALRIYLQYTTTGGATANANVTISADLVLKP